jgi:anti-sigma28 factor (negative regulator of flagellin synthesis)
MQISTQQIQIIEQQTARRAAREASPVRSVEELAARSGVRMDEVRRVTERTLMAEEDPARERRLRDLARRIAEGRYQIDAEQVVDMAERRAIADRAAL